MKKTIAALCAAMLLCTSHPAAAGADVLKLPSSLRMIAGETFLNCASIDKVEVSSGTVAIAERAFAFSGLREISLPASITHIAEDAFEGCRDLCIEAEYGSYAYRWAQEHDLWVYDPFEPDSGDNGLGWA